MRDWKRNRIIVLETEEEKAIKLYGAGDEVVVAATINSPLGRKRPAIWQGLGKPQKS